MTIDLKAYSQTKLRLYNQARALDEEIHLLKEREQILESEAEGGIQGLTEVELSWAECRDMLTNTEKKVVDAAVALIVTDIISASVSLEQTTTVAAPNLVSANLLSKPTLPYQGILKQAGKEEVQLI